MPGAPWIAEVDDTATSAPPCPARSPVAPGHDHDPPCQIRHGQGSSRATPAMASSRAWAIQPVLLRPGPPPVDGRESEEPLCGRSGGPMTDTIQDRQQDLEEPTASGP